jgi:SAM-dependent methyltransferase
MDVEFMLQDNLNAYGVDLPRVSRFWRERGYPADHFICGGVLALPFPDERFDAVLSLGVIEHIGTTTGHCTLADDWQQQRLTFVRELLRVLRPGGRLLLACPNKWFPIDVQHGVYDGVTRAPLREAIYNRTGMNIHRTWGRYHLPSYGDVGRWFAGYRWQTLPLSGYFGFGFLDRRGAGDWLRRGVTRCIDDFPSVLRQTPLNPYILIEVSKPGLAELA